MSLQALVGGDRRVIEAHRMAVERALGYDETLVACRVTEDGITRSERTGNLVVARFNHDLFAGISDGTQISQSLKMMSIQCVAVRIDNRMGMFTRSFG